MLTHTRSVEHRIHDAWRGLLRVLVDGAEAIRLNLFWDMPPGPSWGVEVPSTHTAFGQLGTEGRSYWKEVGFSAVNPRLLPWQWGWRAADGLWPDHYQRTRLVQTHGKHPDQTPGPDHGYSSWLVLPDGRIAFVDYTNRGDPPGKSHPVGGLLEVSDFA